MSFSLRRSACPALLGLFFLTACSRPARKAPEERVAILRFENLGADVSTDWLGRGLSELVTEQLAGQPGRYALSGGALHTLERGTGARPGAAPGISTESTLALLAGANRVGYGQFDVRGGRLEARLFLEDVPARKFIKVAEASGASGDVIAVADALARQIAPDAVPSGAHNNGAVRSYVNAIESTSADDMASHAEMAVAADPGFTPAYRLLAQSKARRHDLPGALAVLEQAAPRAASALERARIHFEEAGLRNDFAGRRAALVELAQADPGNPDQWRALADALSAAHAYAEAAAAFRKELALDPENRNTLNQLAYASANAGDLPAALEALRQYRALAPDDPNAIDSLGDIQLAAGQLRQAEQTYLSAYKKDPKFLGGADLFKAAMARLMTGDVAGATEIHERYVTALSGDRARIAEIERAEWAWTTGQRKPAYRRMLDFARAAESGPRRDAVARCYAELALWSLFLGDRAAAADLSRQAMSVPGEPLSAAAIVARYLAQPPATAAEWTARADKLFANPSLEPLRDLALAAALLLDKQYQPAEHILRKLYGEGMRTPVDEGIPAMLAWALAESGRYQEAAALLRSNPLPPATGINVFTAFYFPRIYYVRGLVAEKSGKTGEAREAYRLFLRLSGPDALGWGEERKAEAAIR